VVLCAARRCESVAPLESLRPNHEPSTSEPSRKRGREAGYDDDSPSTEATAEKLLTAIAETAVKRKVAALTADAVGVDAPAVTPEAVLASLSTSGVKR